MNKTEAHNSIKKISVLLCAWLVCVGFAGCKATSHDEISPVATAQKEPYTPSTFVDRRQPGDLRVMSYNVNFDSIFPINNPAQAPKFARVMLAVDPDVLCLQEIRRPVEEVERLLERIMPLTDGRSWYVYKGYSNVIISRYPLMDEADKTIPPGQRGLAMALVDLPDDRYDVDLYVINNHFKCCGGEKNEGKRRLQADAVVSWVCDATLPGGEIDLPQGTAIVLTGDLNTVEGDQPLRTLLSGEVANTNLFAEVTQPDWDRTSLTDARPVQNNRGADDYTWRDDHTQFKPSRLDYVIYSDSVIEAVHRYILNTTTMTAQELQLTDLQVFDVTLDQTGAEFDHLPVIVDFRMSAP